MARLGIEPRTDWIYIPGAITTELPGPGYRWWLHNHINNDRLIYPTRSSSSKSLSSLLHDWSGGKERWPINCCFLCAYGEPGTIAVWSFVNYLGELVSLQQLWQKGRADSPHWPSIIVCSSSCLFACHLFEWTGGKEKEKPGCMPSVFETPPCGCNQGSCRCRD